MDTTKLSYEERYGRPDGTSVDDKSRIVISEKKQSLLGDNFVLYIGKLGFIEASSVAFFKELCERLDSVSSQLPSAYQVKTMLLANVEWNNKPQANNRVVIPATLARLAQFEKGVPVTVSAIGEACVIARNDHWDKFTFNGSLYPERTRLVTEALAAIESIFKPQSPMEVR